MTTPWSTAIEFRGALDHTVEAYCTLCLRVIFEIHEESVDDGLTIVEDHWKKFHGTTGAKRGEIKDLAA